MLDADDLRVFAQEELASHTPANQENNGYERCALCHYTRHPCDVYDLAAAVLRLLDRPAEFGPLYQEGHVSLEFDPDFVGKDCQMGVQVAPDGRVWVCIDGASFLRFKPGPTTEQLAEAREWRKANFPGISDE